MAFDDTARSSREMSLYRSVELRIVLAAAVGAAALALALLAVLARHTDLLMLDFRAWRPSSSIPGLAGAEVQSYFESLQTPIPEQRPFRLSLQLPATARPGDVVAAERQIPAAGGEHCFLAFTFTSPPAPSTAATAAPVFSRVLVNGVVALSSGPLPAGGPGGAIYLRGIRPHDGGIDLRLEAQAGAPAPGAASPSPVAVHFEFASLRECGSS